MLISPPFLPVRNANQTDAQWLETAMSGAAPGYIPRRGDNTIAGNYPVSMEMGWHGGMHLVAPNGADGHALPVRAIADGTVVFVRQPTQANDNHDDPLNYGAPDGARCWTSDGVVVIRHDTEIGADAQDQPVAVTFYSVYMHLDTIRGTVRPGRQIYRKDEIGEAGFIYGQPHRIHFEIFCDDANLQRLVGRNTGDLPLDRDGRSDVVFGELYFHLPAGTPVYGEKPLPNNPVAHRQPPAPHNGAPLPPITPLQATYTTSQAFVIGMRYAHGEGADGHRGDVTVTTYRLDGEPEGVSLVEPGAEYNLYRDATAIANAYPANGRPSPSSVFEVLRFGRVIDSANETLTPANVPHWRQIRYPGGTGWVNLNDADIHKFSDADFPHWKQWRLIDDSTDRDSRCDSATILAWFDSNQSGRVDAAEANAGFASTSVQAKLERAICKFPTEWSAATIDTRWGWLKTSREENPTPLTDEDFAKFKAHASALCFWDGIAGLPETPWRFHPRQFIASFRRSVWLSAREFAQCIPRRQLHLHLTTFSSHVVANWSEALRRANVWATSINKANRKYSIASSPSRLLHFIAQASEECGWFSLVKEGGGQNASYAPYYGRGLIQLTHSGNYRKYGLFRAFPSNNPTTNQVFSDIRWDPNTLIAQDNNHFNAHNCADSAGTYWTCPEMTATGRNTLTTSDNGIALDDAIAAAKSTNGNVPIQNVNGLAGRLQAFVFVKYVLLDSIRPGDEEALTFDWRRSSNQEPLFNGTQPILKPNGQQKTGYVRTTHTIRVNLEPQRP